METIRFPFGPASSAVLSATGNQTIEVDNDLTLVDGVITPATGDRTINLSIPEDIKAGARLMFSLKSAATEKTIFGNNITGASITGVAGKTKTVEAMYNGTVFVVLGTAGQID